MYLRWKRRQRLNRWTGRKTVLTVSLVRCERRDGKPRQILVGYLGIIEQELVGDINARHHFWQGVGRRLDNLALDPPQRKRVEHDLAAVVTPLSSKDIAAVKRARRQLWRGL